MLGLVLHAGDRREEAEGGDGDSESRRGGE